MISSHSCCGLNLIDSVCNQTAAVKTSVTLLHHNRHDISNYNFLPLNCLGQLHLKTTHASKHPLSGLTVTEPRLRTAAYGIKQLSAQNVIEAWTQCVHKTKCVLWYLAQRHQQQMLWPSWIRFVSPSYPTDAYDIGNFKAKSTPKLCAMLH